MELARRGLATCIYCGRYAGTREHIFATRFIEVLREDPRRLRLPLGLTVPLADGTSRRIGGKRTRRGSYTLEYTTRVCEGCNSGWMNDVDTAAFSSVAEMIRGHAVVLDVPAQAAVAAWICKVAVTARSAPHCPLPIETEWTAWLYEHRSVLPIWRVWLGRYNGSAPWWYNPHDVRIELGPGSAAPPPGARLTRAHGVLATLVVGYLVIQVFGVGGDGVLRLPAEPALRCIWPTTRATIRWPPAEHIDDAGLPRWAERLLHVAPDT